MNRDTISVVGRVRMNANDRSLQIGFQLQTALRDVREHLMDAKQEFSDGYPHNALPDIEAALQCIDAELAEGKK